jgi:hypothetical protein
LSQGSGERVRGQVKKGSKSRLRKGRKSLNFDLYALLLQGRGTEVERKVINSIPYGDAEHQVNVFRGNNQTEQAQFTARAPKLAEFYKREARDVEIPIFGKGKNMTVEARLSKDPSTAALIQVAGRVHEDWLAQDRAAAQEQRAAAEEALRKLESQAA